MPIRTACVTCRFRIEPNATSADVETLPTVSGAHAKQISLSRPAPGYGFGCLERIAGDSQRGGKIISGSGRQ